MKKTKKIVAVILSMMVLLSTTQIFAGAAGLKASTNSVKSQEIKDCSLEDGDELKFRKTYRVNPGDTLVFDDVRGADYTDCFIISDDHDSLEYTCEYDEDGFSMFVYNSVNAVDYGVAVVKIEGIKEHYDRYDEWDYDEIVDSYYVLVVVKDPEGMGSVTDMTAYDETFRYKENGGAVWAWPVVETKNDDFAYYTTIYIQDDYEDVPYVEHDGTVYTDGGVGSTHCTVYVVDAAGHIFQDSCTITVKYVWWQWIIKIVLFGWIWY